MKTLITSDLHLGVRRAAGTTPASAKALQDYLSNSFRALTMQHTDKDLLVAGDIFDSFTVETNTLLEAYTTLSGWLEVSVGTLFLQSGNHDANPRGSQVSSFHLLAHILKAHYGGRVVVADTGFQILKPGLAVISHVGNQDLFDMEVSKALELRDHVIVVHANYENNFALHSDHSLNLDTAQTAALTQSNLLLMAHEHQHRTMRNGRAICMGNPFPSSISDCLTKGDAQSDGMKYAWVLSEDGMLDEIVTWEALTDFDNVDWREVKTLVREVPFVRVCGKAKAAEASLVLDTIANLRANHNAFVISNAVQVDGQEGVEEAAESTYAAIKVFDVMGALLNELEEDERKVIKEVMQ